MQQCGPNIETDDVGTVSIEGCYIPVGWGSVVDKENFMNVSAELCTQNRFGYPTKMYSIFTSPCQSCDPNTFTEDVLLGIPAEGGYMSPQQCLVKPGWGVDLTLTAVPCKVGTYNVGLNRRNCQECPAQYTTLWEMTNSSSHCVMKPGW